MTIANFYKPRIFNLFNIQPTFQQADKRRHAVDFPQIILFAGRGNRAHFLRRRR